MIFAPFFAAVSTRRICFARLAFKSSEHAICVRPTLTTEPFCFGDFFAISVRRKTGGNVRRNRPALQAITTEFFTTESTENSEKNNYFSVFSGALRGE